MQSGTGCDSLVPYQQAGDTERVSLRCNTATKPAAQSWHMCAGSCIESLLEIHTGVQRNAKRIPACLFGVAVAEYFNIYLSVTLMYRTNASRQHLREVEPSLVMGALKSQVC